MPLHGNWLRLARAVWLATATLAVIIVIASIVVRFQAFDKFYPSSLPEGWTPEMLDATLAQAGLTPGFYIVYNLVFAYTLFLGYSAIATLIDRRRADDAMALFVAFWLITWPIGALNFGLLVDTNTNWRLPIEFLSTLGTVLILPFFLLFPDGHFVPRWTRLVLLAWIGWALLAVLWPTSLFNPDVAPPAVNLFQQAFFIGMAIFAQFYRYFRVSGSLARQQTKWVIFGVVVMGLSILVYQLLGQIFPVLTVPGRPGLLYLMGFPVLAAMFLVIPISLGVAILRYRLYDIDLIIRRTLIYGVLTGLLAIVYLTSIVLLQSVFRSFTWQRQDQLAIVLATLTSVALFTPLRRGVQERIDRRFFRRKYDTSRVVTAFAATCRDEVNLERLMGELLRVVQETVQPTEVSLWLRQDGEPQPSRRPVPHFDVATRDGEAQLHIAK